MTPRLHSDYPKSAYALLSRAEERHFWFRGRNTVIRNVIERTFPRFTGKRFLEIGCGTGYVLRELDRMGLTVTGLDMHADGLVFARKRVPDAVFITGDMFRFTPKKRFDAVGIFDVIEHITDDRRALQKCGELLVNNGMLFITVPARPELRSVYDDISGHKRRYTKETLTDLLIRSGFRIRFIGYAGFFQYIPHFIMKRLMLGKIRKNDTMSVLTEVVRQPPAFINWLLEKTFGWDMWLSRYIALPVGTSLIASAEKTI